MQVQALGAHHHAAAELLIGQREITRHGGPIAYSQGATALQVKAQVPGTHDQTAAEMVQRTGQTRHRPLGTDFGGRQRGLHLVASQQAHRDLPLTGQAHAGHLQRGVKRDRRLRHLIGQLGQPLIKRRLCLRHIGQ